MMGVCSGSRMVSGAEDCANGNSTESFNSRRKSILSRLPPYSALDSEDEEDDEDEDDDVGSYEAMSETTASGVDGGDENTVVKESSCCRGAGEVGDEEEGQAKPFDMAELLEPMKPCPE